MEVLSIRITKKRALGKGLFNMTLQIHIEEVIAWSQRREVCAICALKKNIITSRFLNERILTILVRGLYNSFFIPGCNYYTGKWVKGVNKPLYSGKSCKRWLSGMWACREMNGRPSFDYESYKWQPDGCNLPVFRSRDFLSRLDFLVTLIKQREP